MANAVFGGRSQRVKGAIKAEHVKLTGSGFNTAGGAVVQQVQVSFERSMNMIYEIGSPNVYYVGDRRRGTIQGSRVVAGTGDFKAMIRTYGDMCRADSNNMSLKATSGSCSRGGGGGGGDISYNCKGVVLVNLGASVTAQDIVITESVGFQFVELEYV